MEEAGAKIRFITKQNHFVDINNKANSDNYWRLEYENYGTD